MHSRFGYSATSEFKTCPYRYKLRWIDGLEVLPDDSPSNALILGTALHRGIETDAETAIQEYYMSYPVISDLHVNEAIKLEYMINEVKKMLVECENIQHEVSFQVDDFIGTIDLLECIGEEADGTKLYNIYDFKYSNNEENYMESSQLHIYKEKYEMYSGQKVVGLYYIFAPKTMIRQKKDEDLYQFRQRLHETLMDLKPFVREVKFNPEKVEEYYQTVYDIKHETEFKKTPSKMCDWCDYQLNCERGLDYMLLPSIERREIGAEKKRKLWIYGAPFSGKTTMLDDAPNPLNLNTDGNIQFVSMPYLKIADIVTVEGRITKRKFAWDVFKETLAELEKKQNEFQTIIIDLVEDTREMCRLYMYDKLGIQHESDSGFGKGWDIIKTEYLSTMRRFFNLEYENLVVVSHETVSEIKLKSGQTITKISPNIQEAVANKLAGMVDIVGRVVVEEDGEHTMSFKSSEYVFGGGRLKGTPSSAIPLSWDEFTKVYDSLVPSIPEPKKETGRRGAKKVEKAPEVEEVEEVEEAPVEKAPVERSRRKTEVATPEVEEAPVEEAPVRRTRKPRV